LPKPSSDMLVASARVHPRSAPAIEGDTMATPIRTLPVALLATALQACGGSHARCSALITFSVCADSVQGVQSLTVRSTQCAFVDESERQLSGGARRTPVFHLVDGTGPDHQWSWHVDATNTEFADFTAEVCDGCPSTVEANKSVWLSALKTYCPWTASVTAVVAER